MAQSFFYKMSLLIITGIISFTIINFRLGGVVPEDFVNSEIPINQLTFDTFQVYSSNEWRRLAMKMTEQEGQLEKAREALHYSLAIDPTNALSVAALAQLYARQGKQQESQDLFSHSQRLWPAKIYQLRVQHAKSQVKQHLDIQIAGLKQQIQNETELEARIKYLKDNYNKQLEQHLQKLEQDTLNAYQ